jgi:hypothetical protein
MKPSSFCTMCTFNCSFELIGLLLSLSLYHTNEKIYIISDNKTKNLIENITPKPRLNIVWLIKLDKYDGLNRFSMDKIGIWTEFQMSKPEIMSYALQFENDTLFLDSDIIITDIIEDIDNNQDLGVSRQYITQEHIDNTGLYNGGMIWTKNKNVPNDWIEFTKTSRYYDQASIEDLVKKYTFFEFPENYNLQCWRMIIADESKETIASYVTSEPNDTIYFKKKPIKFIHTHFYDKRFEFFNNCMLEHIFNAKMYKILAIIFRVIHNKWIIKIPKQPMQGLGYHKNDSYRELALMLKINNKDVELKYENNSHHCWIEPNIIAYDRPTLNWINEDVMSSSLLLLGNGDIDVEGKLLVEKIPSINVKPWIFWPRRPMILEKILKNENILSYDNRKIETIFIGNIENDTQNMYRNTNLSWESVISEYHCTQGSKHKFSHTEYLMKLRDSKYGLCLRGYGSKCHREVELMAFGTIPIVTPGVSINSYMDPLIENTHYILVNNPEELKEKVKLIPEKKWKVMSNACFEWYQRNVHSKNSWNNMISKILYDFDMKKDKIVFFGASVTAQPNGYVDKCVNKLNNYKLIKVPFGGMHLNDAGYFFLDEVVKFQPKYCFIDFFGTGYMESNDNTKLYINNIITTLKRNNIFPIFLILPRKDLEEHQKKREEFLNMCIKQCKMYNSEIIDLRYLTVEHDFDYFLKDIVHTTNEGAELFADNIDKNFKLIENKSIEDINYPPENETVNFKKIFFDKNEKYSKLKLKGTGKILSIFQKIGPHSSNVDVIHENGDIEKHKIWDKHCVYERNHFNIHNVNVVNGVTIELNNDILEYETCENKNIDWNKYEKCLKPQIIYYTGELEIDNLNNN